MSSLGPGGFDEIFAPGLKHLREEKERQIGHIQYAEDADPPWDIDLDAGTVRLDAAPTPAAASPPEDGSDA